MRSIIASPPAERAPWACTVHPDTCSLEHASLATGAKEALPEQLLLGVLQYEGPAWLEASGGLDGPGEQPEARLVLLQALGVAGGVEMLSHEASTCPCAGTALAA